MPTPTINPDFTPVLEPLGNGAGDFFLAAGGLYHAHKISFGAAAALAALGYEEFHDRLKEHFGPDFVIADEAVEEDLQLVDVLVDVHGQDLSSQVRRQRRSQLGGSFTDTIKR